MNPQENPNASFIGFDTPLAYVRPNKRGENAGFAVCAADGTQLAIFASEEAAIYAARQHDLEAVLIH